jgi:hypothetical protein
VLALFVPARRIDRPGDPFQAANAILVKRVLAVFCVHGYKALRCDE